MLTSRSSTVLCTVTTHRSTSSLLLSALSSAPRLTSSVPVQHRRFSSSSAYPVDDPRSRVQFSLQRYDRHLLIASRTPFHKWPKRIELPEPTTAAAADNASTSPPLTLATLSTLPHPRALDLFQHFSLAMKDKQFTSNPPIAPSAIPSPVAAACPRLTIFDIGESGESEFEEGDIIALSQAEIPTRIHLLENNNKQVHLEDLRTNLPITLSQQQATPEINRFVRILGRTVATNPVPATSAASPSAYDYEILAFVCCHTQRDARCGERGPALVTAINEYTKQNTAQRVRIRAFPCSHIGGHEFAGNVLLYGFKRSTTSSNATSTAPTSASLSSSSTASDTLCDWFGLLSPRHIPSLLDAYSSFLRRSTKQAPSIEFDLVNNERVEMLKKVIETPHQKQEVSTQSIDASCSVCDPNSTSSSSSTSLVDIWRGAMSLEKSEARKIAQRVNAK